MMTEPQRYSQHRPYPEPPERLADLIGPTAGTLKLPITIDWGPSRIYDLALETDRRIVYERVLREAATTEEVCLYVNASVILTLWSKLWLPQRLRRSWEGCFPELVLAA